MSEEGVFSIIDTYLGLAARDRQIVAFRADEYSWRDIGRPESLKDAVQDELT
jgi:NDP-sugar pyrophosphorylase family protein